MKRKEIRELFESLSRSQGLYGRLLNDINNSTEEEQENFWSAMENMNFKDELDVILYWES